MTEPTNKSKVLAPDALAEKALLDDDVPPTEANGAAVEPGSLNPTPPVTDPALEASTPAERWRKTLTEAKMDEVKACKILDAFVSPGFYHEEFDLLGGRVRITLRTRESENRARVIRATDRLVNPTPQAVWEVINQYNLAGSLWKFWKKGMKEPQILPFPTSKSTDTEAAEMFDRRMDFMFKAGEVSDPMLTVMYDRLFWFDKQVGAALSDGAASGF